MKKFCLPLVLLGLLSGNAYASHPLPGPVASCTDGEFTVSVRYHDGRHGGGSFIAGRVFLFDGDSVAIIAAVDGLVPSDNGPNIIWRGDGFFLRVNTSKRLDDTSLFPAKFNGRDDDGNPILTGNLVCTTFPFVEPRR
jgi:hypothetical protein